jgi:hypothetical protein
MSVFFVALAFQHTGIRKYICAQRRISRLKSHHKFSGLVFVIFLCNAVSYVWNGNQSTFLTTILHRGLRNDFFFFRSHLLFPFSFWTFLPFSIWIFISLFSLDFYFLFLYGLLFPSLDFYLF